MRKIIVYLFLFSTLSLSDIGYASIIKDRVLNKKMPLMEERLYIQMPDEAKDISRPHNIMGGPESNQQETRIVLEGDGQSFVVYARELFMSINRNLESDVQKILEDWYGDSERFSISGIKSGDNLKIVKVFPKIYDFSHETILVSGVFIQKSDMTIIFIGIYVTPKTLQEQDDCIKLADNILSSIQTGPKKLEFSSRQALIGNKLSIYLPKDYSPTTQKGRDFSIYRIRKVVPVGERQPSMGIYLGRFPTLVSKNESMSNYSLTNIKGSILNTDVDWSLFESENQKNHDLLMETIFNVSELNKYLKIHIFLSASTENEINELRNIAETLAIVNQ